jgi:protein-tyrosine-phosphatase
MQPRTFAILFMCRDNAARSLMAESYLRHRVGPVPVPIEAASGGLAPTVIHPLTNQVMNEIGVDLEGCRAKSLRRFLGKRSFALAVTLCEEHEASAPRFFFGAKRTERWPVHDPLAGNTWNTPSIDIFRACRDRIIEHVDRWLATSLRDLPTATEAVLV